MAEIDVRIINVSNRGNSSVNGLRRYEAILFAVCFICTQSGYSSAGT